MTFAHRLGTLALAALIPVLAQSQTPAIPKDTAAFTEYIADTLRKHASDTPITVTAPLKLQFGKTQLDLQRLSDTCRITPRNCVRDIDMFVKGNTEIAQASHAPPAPQSLRLIVRTQSGAEHSEVQDPWVKDVEYEPLAADLVAVAVIDTPNAMLFMRRSQLAKVGMTHQQLFARARDNMHATLVPLMQKAPPAPAGKILAIQGGYFEVGRVATPADWAPLVQAQHGTLVIALPAPDIVLYMSAADPASLKAMLAYSRKVGTQVPNPLEPGLLLQWKDGRWERVPGG